MPQSISIEISGRLFDSIVYLDLHLGGPAASSGFDLGLSVINRPGDVTWIAALSEAVPIVIRAGAAGDTTASIVFEGMITSTAIDIRNKVVRLRGTDWSYVLKNSISLGSYTNDTSSEVVRNIADKFGLTSEIAVTATMIGASRVDTFNRTELGGQTFQNSVWDFLVGLARMDGFDIFFNGRTLIYSPPGEVSRTTHVLDGSRTDTVKFERARLYPGPVRVTVKSWNSWLGEMIQHEETTDGRSATDEGDFAPGLVGANVEIVRPDLSAGDSLRLAQSTIGMLSGQGLTVEFATSGGPSIAPRDIVDLRRLSPALDGEYIISSVRRRFSPATGVRQTVRGFSIGAATSAPSLAWLSP